MADMEGEKESDCCRSNECGAQDAQEEVAEASIETAGDGRHVQREIKEWLGRA